MKGSKEEFSTFDVERLLDINRLRLQEWLNRGFFEPYRRAAGKGTKTIFTRENLYCLRLFILLLGMFNSRDTAKELSNVSFQNVGPGKDQYKYALLSYSIERGNIYVPNIPLHSFELLKEKPDFSMRKTEYGKVIIDLQKIKAEVDGLLGE